jgi:DNA gyrase/topoisomerase IV subunit B
MPPKNEISKKYVKLEQREHCLQKPGMWIGSIDLDNTYNIWLLKEQDKMEKRTCQYVPGLFKIFDEVINNAGDHYIRQKKLAESGQQVNLVKEIRVTIDKETGEISVYNSGDGIDIAMHPEHNIYVPELIFGNMLTSTNYTDDEKTWSGLNGAGVKLCNIFSEYFELETVDAERSKLYKQRFSKNMSVIEPPKITACKKKPFTKITFKPDYSRFGGGSTGLSEDMYQVMRKRVYDLCAVTEKDITIYFNEQKLEFKTFEKYVDLYIGSKAEHTRVYEGNENWEIIAAYNDFGGFEQISFVNGMLTIRGGKHVDYIQNQIVKKIGDLIEKKHKGKQIKPQAIKDNIILFVKCTIVNPSFDSQSKETLTTPVTKFGSSKIELSDKFIDKLYKSGIADRVLEICAIQDEKALKKTDGKKRDIIRGIPKLEDANFAGTPKSKDCLLLLCEGDSSASIALSGLAEIGRDKFGVFPLKGKVMNVKDVTSQKIADNEEIANIKKILGLETGKKYSSIDDLRYGGIMLMTDQDSVSGDTPLLLKRDNRIFIDTINNIGSDWKSSFFKEYGSTDYSVWNDKGWTPIVHVMRHRVQKKLYRVITDNGIVDVTEDHSLLDANANKISPGEIRVGKTELLHHFPIKFSNDLVTTISKREAFKLGTLFSPQTNVVELLNAPDVIRTEFVKGYYTAKQGELGLYNMKYNNIGFEFKDKLSAQIMYYMLKSIGYNLKMQYTNKYVIEIARTPLKNTVRKIIDLGYTEDYVYDLETVNHHFQCGIGSICGHNTDGFHIRGLIMNLFHSMWPSLLKDFEFIHCINTPIVKVRSKRGGGGGAAGGGGGAAQISFYSLTDFENWKLENAGAPGWDIKYYKGLGTSTETEAKEWFKNMKQVTYKFTENSNINLDLAFNKQRADDRKEWLSKYDRQIVLNYNTREIPYEDFVNKELIHFSNYDVERSIPSVIDGLKISQRKILYACFKRNLVDKEIKVAQLAAYVAETSAYHHGEVSLQDAIIGMAQDFVGSNNINLLVPSGNYGTRLHGGNDSAQPRYIYTLLTNLATNIFKKQDAQILNYLNDDGFMVEPEYYVPIIPMILVNGAQGIGTGFSTSIPCYNPKDIVALIKRMLNG